MQGKANIENIKFSYKIEDEEMLKKDWKQFERQMMDLKLLMSI